MTTLFFLIFSVNIQDKDGLTPLHLAIIHGHSPEYIEVLLDEEKGGK